MKERTRSALRKHENWIASTVFFFGLGVAVRIYISVAADGFTSIQLSDGSVMMPVSSFSMTLTVQGAIALMSSTAAFLGSLAVTGIKVFKTVRQDRRLQDLHELNVREREVEVAAMEVGDD